MTKMSFAYGDDMMGAFAAPVIALGRITDPAEAEGIIGRGEAELVGLGRALIADPGDENGPRGAKREGGL
jgi:2,4-dienoyl-CoA reductase-like NADH-dependent reductase (Old Yellow Enzyme family)